MKKAIFIIVLFFSVVFYSTALAENQSLSGYAYSPDVGWISLNCENTSSCDNIKYGVLGKSQLSGYGYSQIAGWVNFSPNFGGSNINELNEISGWVYSEKIGWIKFDSAKVFSSLELETKAEESKSLIENSALASMSDNSLNSLLYNLCIKIFNNDQCNLLNSN
jgi:hypothetical protein